jgi:hypothetical protein
MGLVREGLSVYVYACSGFLLIKPGALVDPREGIERPGFSFQGDTVDISAQTFACAVDLTSGPSFARAQASRPDTG